MYLLFKKCTCAPPADISPQEIAQILRRGYANYKGSRRGGFKAEKHTSSSNSILNGNGATSSDKYEYDLVDNDPDDSDDGNVLDEKNLLYSRSRDLRGLLNSGLQYKEVAGFINRQKTSLQVLPHGVNNSFAGDFGEQQYFKSTPRSVIINGEAFSPEYVIRVSAKTRGRDDEIRKMLQLFRGHIKEVEVTVSGNEHRYAIGLQTPSQVNIICQHLKIPPKVQSSRCQVWYATPDVLNMYFPCVSQCKDGKVLDVSTFLDGFGGLGFSRSTCALKIAQLEGCSCGNDDIAEETYDSSSYTICEFRGDEAFASHMLPSGTHHWELLNFKYLTVDHKAQYYTLCVPGASAEKGFTYSSSISKDEWKDVKNMRYIRHSDLALTAEEIVNMWTHHIIQLESDKLAKCRTSDSITALECRNKIARARAFTCFDKFRQSIVVPALFHAYTQNVLPFVLKAFAFGTCTTVRLMFDSIENTFSERRIHGSPFRSGDGRRYISFGEALYYRNARSGVDNLGSGFERCIHLLAICNELQQVLYCDNPPSDVYRFRIRVVTRLLAEAVQRSDLETYLQDETKNDKDNHRWDDKKKIKDEIEEVKRKGGKTGKQSIMGHVYWPNLYIALPCLVERYPLMRVARLNEEKHEQSFLVNKKFVTNARGQQNFQVMHQYAFNRRVAGKNHQFLSDKHVYRYSNYRDIVVRRTLLPNAEWMSNLCADYSSLVAVEGEYVRFKTSGPNSSCLPRLSMSEILPSDENGARADPRDPWETPKDIVVDF